MESPLENAISESLPEQTQSAPSPEGTVPQAVAPVETPTLKVEQGKEPPFNEHPRWKEVQDERRILQQQNQQLMELLQKQQTVVQQPQAPENMTPEEKVFWEKNAEFFNKQAAPIIQRLENELKETKMTQMALIYRDFQSRHPDVSPGSQEEAKIADYFRKGLDLDTAYDAVFAPIKAQKEIEKVRGQQQQKIQQKIQANVETNSVTPSAIPAAEPKNFRDRLRESFKQAGI